MIMAMKGKPKAILMAKRGATPTRPSTAAMMSTQATPNTGSPSQLQGFRKGGKVNKKGKK
jgi:hypothetical protein